LTSATDTLTTIVQCLLCYMLGCCCLGYFNA